jgi:hypothetical protein
MENIEKRVHTRAQYFLIKDHDEAVPIYAFREADDFAAIPALVVDISDGGVQVLSTDAAELSQRVYDLELVVGEALQGGIERLEVHRVWSRPDGVNVRSGFVFAPSRDPHLEWATVLSGAPHHVLRCVLHPKPNE